MSARKKVAVLISGRGSNMLSLIRAAKAADYPAEIALILSNRPDAGGLERAASFGLATCVVDHKPFGRDREAFEKAVDTKLQAAGIELVVLAGFMRILSPWLVERWEGRMLNIHPALLPSFKGLDTHERALETGVKLHGATVHFVSSEMDAGPIIMQGAVPVLDGDTPDTLGARVLEIEHSIYPKSLALIASGKARLNGNRVELTQGTAEAESRLIAPALQH